MDRSARSTGKTLADLGRASSRASSSANKSSQQGASQTARIQIEAANRAARAQEGAANRNARANQQASRLISQAAQQQARAQSQAALQASKAQQQAARDAARVSTQVQRDATRAQTQARRDAAREAQRQTTETQRAAQKSATETARAQERAQREATRQGEQAAREAQRQSRETARVAQQAARDQARAAQQAAAASAKAARDAVKAQERAAREATRTVEREAKAQARAKLRADAELDAALRRRERERASRRAAEDRARQGQINDGKAAAGQLADRGSRTATMGGMAIAGGFLLSAREAIAWEDAFAGVAKTVSASDKELAKMNGELRKMATKIPVAATDLAGIAASAGQLGIKTGAITKFTRTIADLSVATNLTVEQGATDMARFANITKMPQQSFDRLGATIVDLGNKNATTEREILSMSLRIAAAGSQIGMSQNQIMGMGAALSSLGLQAEAGGTAISTIFKKMDGAVRAGGKSLEGFAKVAGMTGPAFQKLFKEDSAKAVNEFALGLGRIKEAGGDLFGTYAQLDLRGIRVQDTLGRLAGNAGVLTKALGDADVAWKENTALNKEASKRYATTASQIKVAENNFKDLGITVGTVLIPAINDLLKTVKPTLDNFQKLSKEQQLGRIKMVAYAGAALLVAGRIKGIVDTVILMRTAFIGARAAMIAASVAGKFSAASIGASFSSLIGVAGPLALVAVAIAGFAIAFYGARDAGTMSAEALTRKWGKLGEVWVAGGDKLGKLIDKLNEAKLAAGETAEAQSKVLSNRMAAPGIQSAPKSDAWMASHPGYARNGQKVDGSHAGGLKRVPKDGYIAELHKDEAVLTKSEANVWRAKAGALDGSIRGLEEKIDDRVISRSKSKTRGTDSELLEWRRDLRNLKRDLAEVRRAGAAAERDAKRAGKAQRTELNASAKAFKLSGEEAQKSAEATLGKLGNLRDGFRSMFGDLQNDLLGLGVIDDPLGGLTRSFERLLKLGEQARTAARDGKSAVEAFNAKIPAASASSSSSSSGSGDGGSAPTSGASSGQTPAFMRSMFAKVGQTTAVQCGQAISDALGSPGFATRVARGTGGRTVRPDAQGRLPNGAVVSQSYGTSAQHFFVVYTDANGVQRKLESTTAGGKRRYRSDRAITSRDLKRITRAALPPGVQNTVSSGASSVGQGAANDAGGGGSISRIELAQSLRDVLQGTTPFGLGNVRALGKGWGAAVRPSAGNAARVAMQTRIGRGDAESEIAALSGIFSDPKRKGDVTKFTKETGIKPRWEKSWTRRDQAVDVLRQLANLEDARTNAIKAGLEAEEKRAASLKEQIANVKAARDEVAAMTRESENGASIVEDQMAFLQRGGGLSELDAYTARLQKVQSLWRDDNSPVVKLFKAGRKTEANGAFKTLMAQFDGAQERAQELDRFRDSIQAVGEALGKLPSLGDVAQQPIDDLSKAMADGETSARDLGAALENLPEALKALEAAAANNPALAAKFAPFLGVIGKARAQVVTRGDSETIGATFDGARDGANSAQESGANAWREWRERDMSESALLQAQAGRELEALSAKMKGATLSPEGAAMAAAEYEKIAGQWRDIVSSSQKLEADMGAQRLADNAKASAQRLDELERDVDTRMGNAAGYDFKKNRRREITDDLNRDGLPVDQMRVDKIVDREEWVSQVEGMMNDVHGIFQSSFSDISGGFSGMFDNILGGFNQMLQKMAAEYLANFVMQQVFGALMGSFGGGGAPSMGGGTGVSLSGGGGAGGSSGGFMGGGAGLGGGFSLGGAHAAGLDRVPRDNYVGVLHKNEAVLNAAQAESWRQQQRAKEVAIAGNSPARRGGDSYEAAASSGSNDIHLNITGPVTVKADNPREFASEMAGQKLPRREMKKRVRNGIG